MSDNVKRISELPEDEREIAREAEADINALMLKYPSPGIVGLLIWAAAERLANHAHNTQHLDQGVRIAVSVLQRVSDKLFREKRLH